MNIDFIETLHALDHLDIRVVRAAYADSADSAIAFAARRDMHDPRAVAIVLSRTDDGKGAPGTGAFPALALADETAIRAAFDALMAAAPAGSRILAREYVAPGTDVAIVGRTEAGRKYMELRAGEDGVRRMIPLTEIGAELMAGHFLSRDHRGSDKHRRRMLEHLTLRAAELFATAGIDSLVLDPIRLHENGYTVLGAAIEASTALHFES